MAVSPDTLTTISELGITLIGVAAIAGVLLSRDGLHPVDRFRFTLVVIPATTIGFMGYVPIWISRYVDDDVLIWQLSSAGMIALILIVIATFGREGLRPSGSVAREIASITPRRFLISWGLIPFANLSRLLANTFSWPLQSNQTTFEIVLFLGLLVAVLQFVALVAFRVRDMEVSEK
jgi:hypothetical protein